MRKLFASICLTAACLMAAVQSANAANPDIGAVFNALGGTTTIDNGGAIHSQARSIYSLGGGMTSFQGKRVSLLAADPPSFSAGCNGISWHFGGFAFISMDEIRQLVEAVAQASLGVAVDLAMQTLCPQCYAVMSKLRDVANVMRNAAADSCKVAQNFGALLQKEGIFPSTKRVSKCSETSAESGKTASYFDALAGSACKMLGDAENSLSNNSSGVMDFLTGNSSGKPVDREILETTGNVTYKALTALGYEDGIIKDVMLSMLGMAIIPVQGAKDCRDALQNLRGSAAAAAEDKDLSPAIKNAISAIHTDKSPEQVAASSSTTAPSPADAKVKDPVAPPNGATKGPVMCYAPPVLEGVKSLANAVLCGFSKKTDMALFAKNAQMSEEALLKTSLGAMCNKNATYEADNPLVYTCRANASGECVKPQMVRLSTLVSTTTVQGYTGALWMVADALYAGVIAVRNDKALPEKTIQILNGSGWPLYRLINMAAVYPALSQELLNAYASAIAAQYVMDSLDSVMRLGSQPAINTKSMIGLKPESISVVREQISEMARAGDTVRTQVLERLGEKRKLVAAIMEMNKAIQAEVIGTGLSGNARLAVSIKDQMYRQNKP